VRWATRPGCHVDRIACAWLLRRFVDPEATFVFAADPANVPPDATPFDMRGVELGHRDGGCSFETMLVHFDLHDPTLWEIARLVHEADIGDDRYLEPSAPGLDELCRAVSDHLGDDDATIAHLSVLFDALYDSRRRRLAGS
jgi:hypothetical protein